MRNIVKLFVTLSILARGIPLFSQHTTLEGSIREEGSGDPIMYAHVFLKSLQAGTTSDTTGHFKLIITNQKKTDTLIISYLGYHTEKIFITPGTIQTFDIKLKPQFTQLQEFVVVAGDNPAWAVLNKVIENKKRNNPEARKSYSCEEYSKIRFDLNHFTEKIKQNVMLRPFDFIWNDVDTTADGVTYLPVLLVEKMIDHYYQQSRKETRDVVRGVNTTGLKGPKIMNFVEDLYLTPNLYDNFVVILDKSFPSPINDNYRNHYEHYLDSVMIDGINYYQITFQPKYKRELAFEGEMLIDPKTYALKKAEFRFDIMANVNFVRSYWVSQKYDKVDGTNWMPVESQVIGDFTVIENSADLTGFFGRKNSTYKNYIIDSAIPASVFKGPELVVQDDSVMDRTDDYWKNNRHVELTDKEAGIFSMVKKLEQDPAFTLRKNLIVAFTSGYVPVKKIDIGNFYTFYSYNVIEHSRLKFGFRTGKHLDWPVSFSAYGAYGTYDEKWKYGSSADWAFGKEKRMRKHIGASYKYDIEQLGRSFNQLEIDNILTSLVQYGGVTSRNYVTDFTAYIDNNLTTGLLSRVSYFNNSISPTRNTIFEKVIDGVTNPVSSYHASGVGVTLKFSYQNYDMNGKFYTSDSKVIFRKYPDLAMQWRWADKNAFASGMNFNKFNIQLKQNVRLQKLGYLQYYIEAGKTWGTVPYPYLNIPFGNQLVFQDDYAFNLMNFLEYASDQFTTLYVQHHFGGLILDHIPLINKLKWRNFIFARAYWGTLSAANNQQVYLFPENLHVLNNNGYYEAGFGIENIFKIARVDFTWRLTDPTAPGMYRFIVKPSFKLSF
jgi:hypothetical protein